MKIICTTSNAYSHIVPVFIYLFRKYWSDMVPVEIVGYDHPKYNLPSGWTFHSMGKQIGGPENFTRDLRKYFMMQDQFFIWLMEDTFIKSVDLYIIDVVRAKIGTLGNCGRFNLTAECTKQDHYYYGETYGKKLYANSKTSLYRLSTQPSIWNRDYVLQYMQRDLSAWGFECQSDYQNDDWAVLGFGKEDAPLRSNEGVRKTDIYKYDLSGFPQEDIDYINALPK